MLNIELVPLDTHVATTVDGSKEENLKFNKPQWFSQSHSRSFTVFIVAIILSTFATRTWALKRMKKIKKKMNPGCCNVGVDQLPQPQPRLQMGGCEDLTVLLKLLLMDGTLGSKMWHLMVSNKNLMSKSPDQTTENISRD